VKLEFTIPGPPQPKERARRGKNGRWYTPERTRAYESHVRWLARTEVARRGWRCEPAAFFVELRLVFADRRRRDVDNCAKSILDACNGVVWPDDAMVTDLRIVREVDPVHPRVDVVVVWPIELGSGTRHPNA
jgi:Holliday junction resolvase RusA-like endonuclease